jgi:hypothetical protein
MTYGEKAGKFFAELLVNSFELVYGEVKPIE